MAQLSIRTENEDGEPVTRTFHVENEHAEDEAEQLQALAEQAQQVPELRDEKSQLENELDTARDVLVSEIVRLKKLSGELSGESDIEDERGFLEGLPVDRLKKHYERAQELDVNTDGNLDPSKSPSDPNPDTPDYDEVGL